MGREGSTVRVPAPRSRRPAPAFIVTLVLVALAAPAPALAQVIGAGPVPFPVPEPVGPSGPAPQGHPQSIDQIRVFAHVPYPGNPGGLAVRGNTLWVDTSSGNFDRPFDASSSIFAYNLRSGQLAARRPNPIGVPKQPVAVMGLAGIAVDASGEQFVADMNGQVLRVDPRTGHSQVYGTIPTSSSTSFTDMPTFDAFGPDGSLYVGDAGGQPVIWRVPPGGGEAQAWFADPRLAGSYGASVIGLAVDPGGSDLYFAVGNQQPQVTIYRLPLADPSPARLTDFHAYRDLVTTPCAPDASDPNTALAIANCAAVQALGPGGIAFGRSGRLYVAFLAKNQISILDPSGTERARFPSPSDNQKLDVPLDGPFGLAFDGRGSLLIGNLGAPTIGYGPGGHLTPPGGLPDSKSWAILSARVDDTAAPLFHPDIHESRATARALAADEHLRWRSPLECFLMAATLR